MKAQQDIAAAALAAFLLSTTAIGFAVARGEMSAQAARLVIRRAGLLARRAGVAQAAEMLRQTERFVAVADRAAHAAR